MPKSKLQPQDIVVLYTVQHLTLRQIAQLAGITHTGVATILKKQRITSHQGEWAETVCAYCGVSFEVRRKRWAGRFEHFCCREHYFASRANPDYKPDTYRGRLARAIVSQHFPLESLHEVHHIDGNQKNNDLSNLIVFASSSDHHKHHHGKTPVKPIWEGATVR